jgi:hypothetical protein
MEELLLTLLSRLEAVGDRDESLYDSVVRQRMGDAIFDGFIKAEPGYVLPDEFNHRMSDADNRLVRDAIGEFIETAVALARSAGLDTFHKRLAAFQNRGVRTPIQKNDTEDLFGWSDAAMFDELGNVIRLK